MTTECGPMTPETALHITIDIRVDDAWWPGFLEYRRRRCEVWEAFVRWSTGVGETRIGWVDYSPECTRPAFAD